MKRMGFCAPENSIVYTGTHDNNTTAGWFREDLDTRTAEAVAAYLDCPASNPEEICRRLVENAYASRARLAIIPVQDILALDGQNRMNMPGTVGTNWKWCLEPGQLTEAHAQWLHELCERYERL
jgi:4-alpha-glucanotransferase